jgi:hypothetical protein
MLGGLFGKRNKPQKFAERDTSGDWLIYFNQYANTEAPKKYNCEEAYSLAGAIAELFYPIDMIADACASLDYEVVDKDTLLPIENFGSENFKRLFKRPNPYSKFSDLVYQGVFSKFSDGNVYDYTKIPDSYNNPNIDLITNIWTLNPTLTKPMLKETIPNPWSVKEKSELISYYKTFFFYKHSIDPRYIKHNTMFEIGRNGKGRSPLDAVEKNINNLLAVYSARLNVYEKNMNGGILSADSSKTGIEAQVDPVERDKIMNDLQNRNGLTGAKNFIGVSSIPLKFIKTIGTINELQPFDETEVDAMAIASVFGLDADLVPKRAPSKYSNKIDGERKLWQTVIKSTAIERGVELSEAFYLPDNAVFYPNFQNVEILQEDKKTSYEADKVLIENLTALKENGVAVEDNFAKIKDKYDSI